MRLVAFQFSLFPYWLLFISFGFATLPVNRIGFGPAKSLNMDSEGIITDNSISEETLVRDIFINGNCDNVENINAIGNQTGIGYFENGSSIIGMENGIIISTGPIENAEGANTTHDMSGNFFDNSGDTDLDILATDEVRDAVGIEFDFVPLDSLVTFRYVFASEEYCEFVGSIFNDVFGFFISGPGIEGEFSNNSMNVALIPGTEDFVAINSVNHIDNPDYYNRNELFEDAFNCEITHQPSEFLDKFQYDGFTEILTAVLKLTPCETYHIRLVVSDVGDNFYDSAVFLEAGSFTVGGAVGLTAVSTINPDNIVNEGCSDGYFLFERLEMLTLNESLEVDILVSDASTAEDGSDFMQFPQSITIPAGQFEYRLPVQTINDNLAEPYESIIVELDIPCACYSDTAQLFITDSPPVLLDLPDLTICSENDTELVPEVSGGIPGYTYEWSTGDTTSSIMVDPDDGLAYYLTVTDFCGHALVDTSVLSLFDPPTAQISGMAEICEGETANLPITFTGDGPWQLGYSIDGSAPVVINGIQSTTYNLEATQGGIYTIFAVYDSNCEGIGSGEGEVIMGSIHADAIVTDVDCAESASGIIDVSIDGGTPPYILQWRHNFSSDQYLTNLRAGTYELAIRDADGCEKEVSFEVNEPSPIETVQYDCAIYTSGKVDINASGGIPPYTYSVDGTNFSDNRLFESLTSGAAYDLWIQDANGCKLQQDFIMPNQGAEMFELRDLLELRLGEKEIIEPDLNIPESTIAEITWTPTDNLSCSDCLDPQVTAIEDITYKLKIVDNFGCVDEKTVTLKVNLEVGVYVPTAFSPNDDGINDRFTIFGDEGQVQEIISLKVFDRWGALVFKNENFPPNESRYGWDGYAHNKDMDPGIFAFFAEIQLVNGARFIHKGEVVLIR